MQKMPMTHPLRMLQKISKEKEAIVLDISNSDKVRHLLKKVRPDSLTPPVLTSFSRRRNRDLCFWSIHRECSEGVPVSHLS